MIAIGLRDSSERRKRSKIHTVAHFTLARVRSSTHRWLACCTGARWVVSTRGRILEDCGETKLVSMPCTCSHSQWDHEIEEDWDNVYFFGCEIEGCGCKKYQEVELVQIKLDKS
jgi:hypothetical protein